MSASAATMLVLSVSRRPASSWVFQTRLGNNGMTFDVSIQRLSCWITPPPSPQSAAGRSRPRRHRSGPQRQSRIAGRCRARCRCRQGAGRCRAPSRCHRTPPLQPHRYRPQAHARAVRWMGGRQNWPSPSRRPTATPGPSSDAKIAAPRSPARRQPWSPEFDSSPPPDPAFDQSNQQLGGDFCGIRVMARMSAFVPCRSGIVFALQ